MTKKDDIKDLFSSKLKGFEADLPVDLWDAIDHNLDTREETLVPLIAPNKSNKKKQSLILAVSAIAASLLVLTLCILPESNKLEVAQEDNISIIEKEGEWQTKTAVKPNKEDDLAESVIEENSISPTKIYNVAVTNLSASSPTSLLDDNVSTQINDKQTKALTSQNLPISTFDSKSEASDEQVNIDKECKELEGQDGFDEPLVLKRNLADKHEKVNVNSSKEKSKQGGWGLSLNSGLLAVGADKTEQGGTSMFFSHDERSATLFRLIDSPSGDAVELEHSQPVSVGVLVSKDISSKFSVETGLVYTHLSSKAKVSNSLGLRESQKFDYLGIPLNLTYNFLKLGKARFYLTGGVMFQKDVNGSYKSHLKVDYADLQTDLGGHYSQRGLDLADVTVALSEPERIKKSIHQSNIQVSVHGLAGASFAVYKSFNIFGTAGVGYYFKAGNKYNTIYSDKKTQFDINFGVKFNF